MSTLDNQLYIDAVVVYGIGRTLTVQIDHLREQGEESTEHQDVENEEFDYFDLTPYAVRFRVLGSADGAGQILIEKVITQETDEKTVGQITDPDSGQFSFTITADDTRFLGIGARPISIELVDPDTLENIYTLTEGGIAQGEFSRLLVVRP